MADGGVDSSDSDGEEAKVYIRGGGAKGLKFYVRANLNTTVVDLKSIVAQECSIPAQQQKLIHQGRLIKDDETLRNCGIKDDQTIYLVGGSEPAAPADTTNDTGIQNTNSTSTDDGSDVGRRRGRPPFGPSFFPELDPDPQLGSFSEIEQMRQLVQDPNMVRYIFNIPIVQVLFNNPETVCNMLINKHPLGDIVDRNPEVAHIMNDPVTLRVILDAVHEIMCNSYRAMSNIESPPGHFDDTLRQLSEDLARAKLGHKNRINSPAPNTNPLPNPWASTDTGRTYRNSGPLGNPIGNTMADSPAVFDFPDLKGLPESILAITGSNEYPEDPMLEETIHRLLYIPQFLTQMLDFSQRLRDMLDSNPPIRDVMQNPEFTRRLATPRIVNAFLIYHRALVDQVMEEAEQRRHGRTGDDEVTSVGTLRRLMDLFGDLATRAGMLPAPQDPPEVQYATQLVQLQEMGFSDTQENIRALIATAGDVQAAVERLLQN